MSSPNISFYENYKNAGVALELVVAVGIRAVIVAVGLAMNLSLLIVTIRSRTLRSICNLLIALDTTAISLFLPVNLVGFGLVLSGTNFMPSWLCCFVVQPLPLLGLNFSVPAMLFIAVDRFLSVAQPIWHSQRRKASYLMAISALCLLYSIYMLQLLMRNVVPSSFTMCSLASDCMQQGIGTQYSTNLMIINGITIALYVGTWLLLKYRSSSNSSAANQNAISYTQRIFKPLAVLISFYMVSYVLNASIRIWLYPIWNLTPVQLAFSSSYLTAFSNLSMICNGPILYIFSTEYRKAYNRVFGWAQDNEVQVQRVVPTSSWNNSRMTAGHVSY